MSRSNCEQQHNNKKGKNTILFLHDKRNLIFLDSDAVAYLGERTQWAIAPGCQMLIPIQGRQCWM